MHLHLFASRTTPNGSAPGFCKYGLVVDNKEYFLAHNVDGIMSENKRDVDSPSTIVELLYPNGYNSSTSSDEESSLEE